MNEPDFKSAYKDDFYLFLEIRKKSLGHHAYNHDVATLKSFDNYLYNNSLSDFTQETIESWIAELNNLSDGTVNIFITTIRVFLNYYSALYSKHVFVPEYRTYPETYIPYYFSSDDKHKIYDLIDNYKPLSTNTKPWIQFELPMVVRIIDSCGTRVEEVLKLKMQDIELENAVLIMRNAKGDRQRRVPMSESLSKILYTYCCAMGLIGKPDAYLFPRTTRAECLVNKDIYLPFLYIISKLGIRNKDNYKKHERGPCLYNLRHTFAVDSFKQLKSIGMDTDDAMSYLSIYLGHYDFDATYGYLKSYFDAYPEDINPFFDVSDELAPKEDKWEKWGL